MRYQLNDEPFIRYKLITIICNRADDGIDDGGGVCDDVVDDGCLVWPAI